MNRLFGNSKNKEPATGLTETLTAIDSRIEATEQKIRKLDTELLRCKGQLARLPDGPSKESLKREALQILQQKKQYESQKTMMMSQSFNLEQTNFTVEGMKSTVQTVQVMKATAKDMQKQLKQINIDKVEDLREQMEDFMTDTFEINEVLARSYGTPDYIDEADLEAELGMLQELQEVEENPSYLQDIPSAPANSKEKLTGSIMAEPQQ